MNLGLMGVINYLVCNLVDRRCLRTASFAHYSMFDMGSNLEFEVDRLGKLFSLRQSVLVLQEFAGCNCQALLRPSPATQ